MIDEKALIREMRKAHKGSGLRIARMEHSIVLSGPIWQAQIDWELCPNEIKGEVVRMTGTLPDVNDWWSVTRDGIQMELEESYRDILGEWEELGLRQVLDPGVVIRGPHCYYRILRGMDFPYLVKEEIYESLMAPFSSALLAGGSGIYWVSKTEALRIHARMVEDLTGEDEEVTARLARGIWEVINT